MPRTLSKLLKTKVFLKALSIATFHFVDVYVSLGAEKVKREKIFK